jgi:hypothetical protein
VAAPLRPSTEPKSPTRNDRSGTWPRRAWAWEFLRRNADFRRSLEQARGHVEVEREGMLTIVRLAKPAYEAMARWEALFRQLDRRRR